MSLPLSFTCGIKPKGKGMKWPCLGRARNYWLLRGERRVFARLDVANWNVYKILSTWGFSARDSKHDHKISMYKEDTLYARHTTNAKQQTDNKRLGQQNRRNEWVIPLGVFCVTWWCCRLAFFLFSFLVSGSVILSLLCGTVVFVCSVALLHDWSIIIWRSIKSQIGINS